MEDGMRRLLFESCGISLMNSRVDCVPADLNSVHCHDKYEILYVTEGSGKYIVEGAEYPIKPRSLMIFPPLMYHCASVDAGTVYEILKTDKMRMFSYFVKQNELAMHRDEVIRRLTVMAEMANEAGITLCHENESAIYGQMPAEVRDILTSVPSIKGIFDPANYRMNDGDVMDGIDATLINLAYLHIKDACYAEQAILPAGEGEGRISDVINIVNEHTDETVMLTLEPHLFKFMAYATIDEHELKGKYSFNNNRESFAFASNSLKNLLINNGYREENGTWKK